MKKKTSIRQIISKLFIFTAVCLLCYPAISDIYNRYHASYVISDYKNAVSEIKEEDYSKYLEQARIYNESLVNNNLRYVLEKDMEEYMSLLNATGSGIMGIVSIPKIKVELPIYHTTDDNVLQVAIGHVPGTSLPIGGESTHSVISGHRGLASASLFTDLPKLALGDIFKITVLNERVTYEVDQIKTVLPDEIEDIKIEAGKDYCTLITCTPLGINSHRLLVRGHRIENIEEETQDNSSLVKDVVKGNVLATYEVIMLIIALILFFIGFCYPLIKKRTKKDGRKRKRCPKH